MGNLITVLLQISSRLRHLDNFENRPVFDEVMPKILLVRFFRTLCSLERICTNMTSCESIVLVVCKVYIDHHRGAHRLSMSVSLPAACRHVDADRLLVKANRSGTRIRVVSEQSPSGHRRHPDNDQDDLDEQFTLPVTVDPYGVTARLEHARVLVIEAPVVML